MGAFIFGGPEENRFSQARRPLGHRGSDVPQARHSLPLPSILLYDCKKKSTPLWVLSFLVDPRRIDSRRLDARSVIAALTCRRHVIHYRSLRFSFMIAKRKAPLWVLSFLVDPRRIELLSEKRSAGLSPSAFRLLKFPPHSAGRQALCFGSFLMRDGVKS